MDTLEVIKFPTAASHATRKSLNDLFDRTSERVTLREINWLDGCTRTPEVHARIAYNEQHLFLHFDIRESEFRATENQDQGAVWEDSCVEFFIQPDDEEGYYNLECNAIGTLLWAYGVGRAGRTTAPREAMDSIFREAIVTREDAPADGFRYHWSLVVQMPYTVFFKRPLSPRPGMTFRGNFYKCGNRLPHPHYLSLYPGKTGKPDFHRPEYFGTFIFK